MRVYDAQSCSIRAEGSASLYSGALRVLAALLVKAQRVRSDYEYSIDNIDLSACAVDKARSSHRALENLERSRAVAEGML